MLILKNDLSVWPFEAASEKGCALQSYETRDHKTLTPFIKLHRSVAVAPQHGLFTLAIDRLDAFFALGHPLWQWNLSFTFYL